jgi:hypothetical protein
MVRGKRPGVHKTAAEDVDAIMNRRTYNFLLPALALLLACLPADAGKPKGPSDNGRLTMSDFRTRGVTSDGKQWMLRGGNAVKEGSFVRMDDVELTITSTDGEKVVITSPKCIFNPQTKVCSSDAPLHVTSRQVTVDGVGYDVLNLDAGNDAPGNTPAPTPKTAEPAAKASDTQTAELNRIKGQTQLHIRSNVKMEIRPEKGKMDSLLLPKNSEDKNGGTKAGAAPLPPAGDTPKKDAPP